MSEIIVYLWAELDPLETFREIDVEIRVGWWGLDCARNCPCRLSYLHNLIDGLSVMFEYWLLVIFLCIFRKMNMYIFGFVSTAAHVYCIPNLFNEWTAEKAAKNQTYSVFFVFVSSFWEYRESPLSDALKRALSVVVAKETASLYIFWCTQHVFSWNSPFFHKFNFQIAQI